jgi:exonuclease III
MTLDLRCVLLNAENLFLLLDRTLPPSFENLSESEWQKFSTSVYPNKNLSRLLKLQKHFAEMDPDLILLTEVGGEESLKNFNQYFLNDNYRVALIEGNSDRSIDVGFLIHKRVSTHFNIISNKQRPINFLYPHERQTPGLSSHKFSRDAAELHLFEKDINKPYFIFILTHLKSPLDPEGIDSFGSGRRAAEFRTLLEIYGELRQQHPKTPIIIAGDLNGNASRLDTDREFSELYKSTDLEDALEVAGVPPAERITFYPLKSGVLLPGRQIDYVLLSEKAKSHLKTTTTAVFRYDILLRGRPLGPQTYEEKLSLPSDHYPIMFTLVNIPQNPG